MIQKTKCMFSSNFYSCFQGIGFIWIGIFYQLEDIVIIKKTQKLIAKLKFNKKYVGVKKSLSFTWGICFTLSAYSSYHLILCHALLHRCKHLLTIVNWGHQDYMIGMVFEKLRFFEFFLFLRRAIHFQKTLFGFSQRQYLRVGWFNSLSFYLSIFTIFMRWI